MTLTINLNPFVEWAGSQSDPMLALTFLIIGGSAIVAMPFLCLAVWHTWNLR